MVRKQVNVPSEHTLAEYSNNSVIPFKTNVRNKNENYKTNIIYIH